MRRAVDLLTRAAGVLAILISLAGIAIGIVCAGVLWAEGLWPLSVAILLVGLFSIRHSLRA
jgi:type IV secretory pathway VirB3-like protein